MTILILFLWNFKESTPLHIHQISLSFTCQRDFLTLHTQLDPSQIWKVINRLVTWSHSLSHRFHFLTSESISSARKRVKKNWSPAIKAAIVCARVAIVSADWYNVEIAKMCMGSREKKMLRRVESLKWNCSALENHSHTGTWCLPSLFWLQLLREGWHWIAIFTRCSVYMTRKPKTFIYSLSSE